MSAVDRTQLNKRTVRALDALDAEEVARSTRDFRDILRSTAARRLAIVRTREPKGNFAQLAVGIGFILARARDLELSLQTGEKGEKEIVKADADRAALVEQLRAWFAANRMPRFSYGDGGDFKFIVRAGSHPAFEIKRGFLAAIDDISIQNYRRLSAGPLKVLRAACTPRCQVAASSSDNSVLARVSARSRPAQTFSLSGTRRVRRIYRRCSIYLCHE